MTEKSFNEQYYHWQRLGFKVIEWNPDHKWAKMIRNGIYQTIGYKPQQIAGE